MGELTFSKSERIVSNKLLEALFDKGSSHSLAAFPLRAVFYMHASRTPADEPVQILVSVPKKRFKHAVDRNRVKRQVREAYRHHKQLVTTTVDDRQCLFIAFIWQADELKPSAVVERSVVNLLGRIARHSKPSSESTARHEPDNRQDQ